EALGVRIAAVAGRALSLFVCHLSYPLSDLVDADAEHRLAVPLGPAVLLAALLLEDEHLLGAHRPDDGGLDGDPGALLRLLALDSADEQDVGQGQGLALPDLLLGGLDPDDVARGDLQLFSAGADDGVHGVPPKGRTANSKDLARKVKPTRGIE